MNLDKMLRHNHALPVRPPLDNEAATVHFRMLLMAQSNMPYPAKDWEEDIEVMEKFFNERCLKKEK
jgi:hypothetical protein